jgi:hypothetical protein
MCAVVLLTSASTTAAAASTAKQCQPRCCAQGQIVDPSGTRCLRDRSQDPIPDPCGRRDSFLPRCEASAAAGVQYVDQDHLWTKPIFSSLKGLTGGDSKLSHKRVLKSLAKYVLEIHGEVVEDYYHEARDPPLTKMNESQRAEATLNLRHLIPASFCIDPDNDRALVCPRVDLDKRATVNKCCPFGRELTMPLFSGDTFTIYAAQHSQ